MTMPLGEGAILQFICKGFMPPASKSTFQVLGTRKITAPGEMFKYRLSISDGQYRFSHAVLMLETEDDVPPDLAVIRINVTDDKNSIKMINNKLIFVVGSFTVVQIAENRLGNPLPIPPEAYGTNQNSSVNEPIPGPSTPDTSTKTPKPPTLAYKRPLEKSPTTIENNEDKAKQARRNLFPSKATHGIKDLNPYQNKYTLQARVIKKNSVKNWSNSRGEGSVFDFIMKDKSGEIKVTAFNEEQRKYSEMIQEGKVYYLSNARIQAVRKPEYNNTGHNYELTIGGQTVIEPCMAKNDVPNIEYNFVPITDIQNVDDKDKIDVLVICTKVEACVTQALKSGKETKKREIRVTDNSKAEIMMTLWGENAEKYDKATLEGKVLAARSVMVTDWNGKSLSCTFGSSLELNPKIPEAEDLKKINLNDTNIQSLSTDRFKPNVEASFVCLRQIHQEFEDSSVQAKYYNLTAYLTDLRSDKIMYKACPGDKCNKMVTDLSNGQYKCEKCRLEFPEFHWRYILRGAIADATDYQWITIFDESARKILGKSAGEMAEIRDRNEWEFRRILHAAKYRQLNFSIKTSTETWNEENRLKVSVVSVEPVLDNLQKHVERLKAEIETLKI